MTAFVDGHDVAFFDLDGVVYLGPVAVEGAVEGVAALRAQGVRAIFVTNNAARSADVVAAHLTALGFPATADDLVTSAQAAAGLLRRELPPGSKVLVAGTSNLVQHVESAGMVAVTTAADEPVAVIQGSDEATRGVVVLKDLILGAQVAAGATLEEWKNRPAQVEVPRADLVAAVRRMIG